MSELQLDDPDPLPSNQLFPTNYETGQAFDDYDLANDLARREQEYLAKLAELELIEKERSAVAILTASAEEIIASQGEGDISKRYASTDGAKLYRLINQANRRVYGLMEDIEHGKMRCRAWVEGDDYVSWCEDEQRYEPAAEVNERMRQLFLIDNEKPKGRMSAIALSQRVKRGLAAAILR